MSGKIEKTHPLFKVLCWIGACMLTAAAFSGPGGEGSGDHAWLGVSLQERQDRGLEILAVVPGSPAESAGLQPGDRVLSVNDSDRCDLSCLGKQVRNSKPGARLSLRILRDGKEQSIPVVLGAAPPGGNITLHVETEPDVLAQIPKVPLVAPEAVLEDRLERFLEIVPGASGSVQWYFSPEFHLGIDLIDIPSELRHHLGGSPEAGVLVGSVKPGSPAEKAGLRAGDLIVKLDGEPVASSREVTGRLAGWSRKEFQVQRIRKGKPGTATLLREGRSEPPFLESRREKAIERAIQELERDLQELEMSKELRESLEKTRRELKELTPDRP